MASETVWVVARITARPEKIQEMKALLQGLVEPTRQEQGCIRYTLCQNNADPTDFTFVEEWSSDEAIDAHFTTPHLQDALAKLEGLLATEPDIRRYAAVPSSGDE